jgi:hypothetical protein
VAAEPSLRRRKEADMSNPSHLIQAAFNAPNLPRKSIGQRAYVGLLIATTSASVLCGGSAAHSGPCTLQITQLERQIQHAGSSLESGPTAPQSVVGLLHHQPTPDTVLNAERKANSDAAAALDRARQADVDGSAVACAKAFDEAKHHWIIPPLS